jgi:hypothetical protein
MDQNKKDRLEGAGWRVGNAEDFLELTPEEAAFVELKLALARFLRDVRVPASRGEPGTRSSVLSAGSCSPP